MNINDTLKTGLTGLLLLCIFFRCTYPQTETRHKENQTVDSLLAAYHDSLVEAPQSVIDLFSDTREQVRDSLNYFKLLSSEARCYYYLDRMDHAFLLIDSIIQFCESDPHSHSYQALSAEAWNNKGVFYQEQGMRDSARIALKMAADRLQSTQQRELLPSVFINLADCYLQDGDYSLSGYYYRKALFAADSLGTGSREHFAIYSGLAKLYLDLGNFTEADGYFQKAEQMDSLCTPYERYFFSNTRGNYYYNTKAYEQALLWFRKADHITDAFPKPIYKAIVRGNMGEIFILNRQPDSARIYLDDARRLFGKTYEQPAFRYYMDGLYASLALLENDLLQAEKLLSGIRDLPQITPLYTYYNNRRLEELYAKKGEYGKAYDYQMKAQQLDDSLRNVKVKNSLTEIDFRYRQDTTLLKKDIQLLSIQDELVLWRVLAICLTLLLLLSVTAAFCWILYKKRKQEKLYWAQKMTVNQLRMKVVRNRISPHFIFNALNIILPAFRPYNELDKPIRLLIKVLRGNLLFSDRIAVPLKDEIQLVKEYLQLRLLGSPDKVQIVWELPEMIPDSWMIPAMFIQIPVENAVKYAFDPEDSEGAYIRIRVTADNQMLLIMIEDNGFGFANSPSTSQNKKSTGIGLSILFQMIDILNSRNKNKMDFSICDRHSQEAGEHGTVVSIQIPLDYTFDL